MVYIIFLVYSLLFILLSFSFSSLFLLFLLTDLSSNTLSGQKVWEQAIPDLLSIRDIIPVVAFDGKV
jgi:hypothetical protein